jgi:hypothetical protein
MSVSVTGNKLISFIRDQLDEAYAKQWTDAKILRSLNAAKSRLVTEINCYQGSDSYFWNHCTIQTVPGQQSYPLPDGARYSSAPKCNGHIDFITDKSSANPVVIYSGDFRKLLDGSTGNSLDLFAIKHNSIWVYPIPASIFNMELYYFYMPEDIVASDALIDFVPGCEYALALQAIVFSKIQVQDSIEDVMVMLEEYRKIMNLHVGGSRSHGKLMHIGEDEEGVQYSEFAG